MFRLRRIQRSPQPPPPEWRRDVRLLAAGRGISMAGAEAGHIALLALAWDMTGSASQASIVLLATVVARTLGAPLSGWIGDHCDRRRVIVGSELAVAVSLCAMAAAQSMAQLMVVCLVHGFAASTCGSALDASVASLVPDNELATANSTLGMARTAGHMLGPVLGGLAVAGFGARSAFLLDAASSIVAAMLVLGIRGSVGGAVHARADGASASGADRSMLAGLRALAEDPVLRIIAFGGSCLCVCFAFVTAAELPLAVEFGTDEAGLGAIVSAWCVGALVGAWLARRVHVEQRGSRALVECCVGGAIVFACVTIVPAFWCVLVLMALGGFAMSRFEVVEMTIIQQRVDDVVRARVLAAYGGLFSAVWGTNLAIAGLVVETWSARAAYGYASVWLLLGGAVFVVLGREIRRQHLDTTLRVLVPRHALESELAEGA